MHALLRLREEACVGGVTVPLVALVDREGSQRFHAVVELILPYLRTLFLHERMKPERVLGAVPVSIVINDPKSVTELAGVHLWVESISRGAENSQLGPVGAGVLLRGQVLYK